MNIRNVLKAYGLLRQFSDDETALLNTLRGLSDSDREQLVESLAPQVKPKPRRKREKKSAHAASLQQQIAGVANRPSANQCAFEVRINDDRASCGAVAGDPIHPPHWARGVSGLRALF